MDIKQQELRIDRVLIDARQVAQSGNVAASDSAIRDILEEAAQLGYTLPEHQREQVRELRSLSRIAAIERLLEHAESEASAGLVTDSDYTIKTIREYAEETATALTPQQEERIRNVFREVRVNSIQDLLAKVKDAAKHGRVKFVDSTLALILEYSESAGVELGEDQEKQMLVACRKVRVKALRRALRDGINPEDSDTFEQYAQEAGIKLTKSELRRLRGE